MINKNENEPPVPKKCRQFIVIRDKSFHQNGIFLVKSIKIMAVTGSTKVYKSSNIKLSFQHFVVIKMHKKFI